MLYREYAVKRLFVGHFEPLQSIDSTTNFKIGSKNSAQNRFMSDIKSFLGKYPLVRILGKNVFTCKQIHTEYDTHPLALYGILSKSSFSQIYSVTENINSFAALFYINLFYPISQSDIFKKFFKDSNQILPTL